MIQCLFFKDYFSIFYIKSFDSVTLCDLVTVFAETKSVTKSRLHCTFNKLDYSTVECYNIFKCRKQLYNNHSLKVIHTQSDPKDALTFDAIRLNVKDNFGARFCNLRPSRNAPQNHFTFGSFYFFPCKQSFFQTIV